MLYVGNLLNVQSGIQQGPPPPPYYDNYSGPANSFLTLDSPNDWAGQSFTTTFKYNLECIELWCKKGPGANVGNVNVLLYAVDGDGHPTGPILGKGIIPNADILEDYAWVSCDLDDWWLTMYLLSAATKYCIVIYGAILNVDNPLIWAGGGDGSGLPNGDQEWSINGGTSWTTDTTKDQLFRCYPTEFLDNYSGTAVPFTARILDNANDWAGQSFTAMKSYNLNRIDIWCEKNDGAFVGDIILALYNVDGEGHPDIVGGVLATGTIPDANVPTDPAWVKCDLSSYNVSVNTKYCIVVHGYSLDAGNKLFWLYDNDAGLSAYAGGDAEWSSNGGESWVTNTTFDQLFRCYSA